MQPDLLPRIGILAPRKVVDHGFASFDSVVVPANYPDLVTSAGGLPVLLPPLEDRHVGAALASVDALLLPGGPDLDPALARGDLRGGKLQRDRWEVTITTEAAKQKLPILGICRGLQVINVAHGGTLITHVDGHLDPAMWHEVDIVSDSRFADVFGGRSIRTGSLHHQAVDRVGARLCVSGRSRDGVAEVVEGLPGLPVLGVQWHPELDRNDITTRLFNWLTDAAKEGQRWN